MEDFRLYRWFHACLQPTSIVIVVLLPILWSVIFYEISQDHKRAEDEGNRSATNFARLTENHVYRTIKRIDDALISLQGTYPDDRTSAAALELWLNSTGTSDAFQVSLLDASGAIKGSSRGPVPAIDPGDRDHFKHLAEGDLNDLFISKPLGARAKGRTAIRLARRLARKDGSFAGIIVASLDPHFLSDFFKSVDTGRHPTIGLIGFDGTVRAAHGPIAAAEDANSSSSDFDSKLLEQAQRAPSGLYWTQPRLEDGSQRLIAYREVEGYPFFVAAALPQIEVFAQQRRNEWIYLATGWSITLALFFATFLATSREYKLKAAAKSLTDTNARFEASLSNMPHGLCMFDREHRLLVCNERYRVMYDLPAAVTAPGTPLRAILEARVEAGRCPSDSENYVNGILFDVTRNEPVQLTFEFRDGRTIAVDYQPMANGGFVAVHQDITQQKTSEAKIAYLAHHDPLTGLLNRASLVEKIDDCLALSRRQNASFALLLLDLDRFKQVNDSHGHPAGDALLQQVGERLKSELRQTDVLARLGGDEFAIIQSAESDPHAAASGLALRLIEIIARPFNIDRCEISIGASIGIAISSEGTVAAGRLMKMADLALYGTKARGRNDFCFFEPGLEEAANVRSGLEADLRHAVAQGDFVLHYQPILDARTGLFNGAEALVRWPHETRGWVGPDIFIPLAEESGLIGEIGQWVMRTACNDAASWPTRTKVAVNISAVQLRDPMIVDYVLCALAESGLPPERLELEITETALIDRGAECLAVLKQFKALGVTVALDDFGTGYSSLSQLTMFPFDKIKIDKSFTMNMTSRADCAAVIAGVLALANSLEISTTAEGVETWQQYNLLKLAGVSNLQGYLIQRPAPASELDFTAPFLAKETARVA
ncbi:MAG: hypothetical protein QOJ15_2543 [Bradyrhizobium sp.]|nr:hypothetical protein [Bradyrhizobium sp.]